MENAHSSKCHAISVPRVIVARSRALTPRGVHATHTTGARCANGKCDHTLCVVPQKADDASTVTVAADDDFTAFNAGKNENDGRAGAVAAATSEAAVAAAVVTAAATIGAKRYKSAPVSGAYSDSDPQRCVSAITLPSERQQSAVTGAPSTTTLHTRCHDKRCTSNRLSRVTHASTSMHSHHANNATSVFSCLSCTTLSACAVRGSAASRGIGDCGNADADEGVAADAASRRDTPLASGLSNGLARPRM